MAVDVESDVAAPVLGVVVDMEPDALVPVGVLDVDVPASMPGVVDVLVDGCVPPVVAVPPVWVPVAESVVAVPVGTDEVVFVLDRVRPCLCDCVVVDGVAVVVDCIVVPAVPVTVPVV